MRWCWFDWCSGLRPSLTWKIKVLLRLTSKELEIFYSMIRGVWALLSPNKECWGKFCWRKLEEQLDWIEWNGFEGLAQPENLNFSPFCSDESTNTGRLVPIRAATDDYFHYQAICWLLCWWIRGEVPAPFLLFFIHQHNYSITISRSFLKIKVTSSNSFRPPKCSVYYEKDT